MLYAPNSSRRKAHSYPIMTANPINTKTSQSSSNESQDSRHEPQDPRLVFSTCNIKSALRGINQGDFANNGEKRTMSDSRSSKFVLDRLAAIQSLDEDCSANITLNSTDRIKPQVPGQLFARGIATSPSTFPETLSHSTYGILAGMEQGRRLVPRRALLSELQLVQSPRSPGCQSVFAPSTQLKQSTSNILLPSYLGSHVPLLIPLVGSPTTPRCSPASRAEVGGRSWQCLGLPKSPTTRFSILLRRPSPPDRTSDRRRPSSACGVAVRLSRPRRRAPPPATALCCAAGSTAPSPSSAPGRPTSPAAAPAPSPQPTPPCTPRLRATGPPGGG